MAPPIIASMGANTHTTAAHASGVPHQPTAQPVGNTPANPPATPQAVAAFIAKWQGMQASELSTAQSFVNDLCDLLGQPHPHPTPEQSYMFERPITFSHGDGSTSPGRVDCYRRGHFVLEAKKLKAASHTKGFDDGLLRARSQAEAYARALPATEGRPPFVLVVDVGTVIEVYAEFSRSGGTYTPFPDPRSHRLALADLARPQVLARLQAIWSDPDSLNPARISAQVTREVADLLARLAKTLEARHPPPQVAAFLTRCLFSMFAEDVGLLPPVASGAFQHLLHTHRARPDVLQRMLASLWADMDTGGFSLALAADVLRFNGKLFKGAGTDGYSLCLTTDEIDLLTQAAQANWREVEPAIFGTLLERALDPVERHALGAHYTPRAYVERLVLPTVIEPLRAEWGNAQAAALVLAHEATELEANPPAVTSKKDFAALDRHHAQVRAKWKEARQQVKNFHHRLCTLRVLDPACGSANFLYVTLEHLKRLEGEVLNQLNALGETQDALDLGAETVTLQQLRGIELNERAAALAELVLWIGWLQWHIRSRGNAAVAEPVVHDYRNIECRDAVLAWDAQELATGPDGAPLTRWDGRSFRPHPVTGEPVPDEAAQVPQWRYVGARQAQWPQADFIVGNPPFIGASTMRSALGDGYVQALRAAWPSVPDSADFVMFWWAHAAAMVGTGQCERMGLITTNSLRQTFNRRVVQAALEGPAHLDFAVADHPWVDGANGAAVRIAMTVVTPGAGEGRLLTVTQETPGAHGEMDVLLAEQSGLVHADLSVGANVAAAVALQAGKGLSNRGYELGNAGFIVTEAEATALAAPGLIKPYRNGRDLTDRPRGVQVIDTFGWLADDLRASHPAVYQWLLERVKPERDVNRDENLRSRWWLHRRLREDLRAMLADLPRYIATVETAKHRIFQWLGADILPDNKLIIIALADAFNLGVLSSEVHVCWALAAGSTLEDRPVYVKTTCFDTFPFPDDDTGLTPELRQRIATLAQQIDDHRKRVLGLPLVPAQVLASAGVGQSGAGRADFCAFGSMRPDPLPADTPPPGPPTPSGEATTTTQTTTTPVSKDLTLTNLYNVREALRQGRPLSAKEKNIHTLGLVGVLHSLHTELDAAVLQAYGWADLTAGLATAPDTPAHTTAEAELLHRLVALNTRRAAEEAQGHIRWLRPEFQNPAAPPAQPTTQLSVLPAAQQPATPGADDTPHPQPTSDQAAQQQTAPATQPWPASLPEQVRAVADALSASPVPLTLEALATRFKGKGPWKKGLPTLLQTLQALGRAHPVETTAGTAWRG